MSKKISAIAYNSLYVNMGHYNGSSLDHYQSHKTKNLLLAIFIVMP